MSLNKIIKFPTIDSKKNLFFLAIFYYAIFFLPMILYAYFYCDDKLLAYAIPAETQNYHNNFFQFSFDSFRGFLASGRFYGLYATHYLIFYFFHDRLSYHVARFLFNLIAVASFAWLLKLITKDTANGRAYIFLMPILFLISIGVEPLTSQGLATQYSAISIALASVFYILWQENKNKKYFYLSLIFFIWSFFHYEIGMCIVPIFIILAVRYRLKNQDNKGLATSFKEYFLLSIKVCFKELKLFNISFLIWVLINIYLQNSVDKLYDGITFNFNLQNFILAWIFQITQSLPFGILNFNGDLYWYWPELSDILCAVFLFVLSYFIFLKLIPKINLKNNYRDIILIGLVLVLVPSGIMSLSTKYQTWALSENNPSAFIQIFLQFLGMGFLLVAFVSYALENSRLYASKNRQKFIVHFFVITFSSSIALINIFNYNIIHKKNIIEAQTQIKIFVKAIKNNVLQDFPTEEKINEKFYNISKYWIPFYYLFENNLDKKTPEIIEKYKGLNFVYMVDGWFTSHFLTLYNKTNALPVLNFYNEKNSELFKKNIKLENFYYTDSWDCNLNIKNKFKKKNLLGIIIAGKLDMIGYACDKVKSKSNQKCYRIMNVLSPKIFIDKEYLFNLQVIIETLNKAFGENIFKDSFEQIEQNLKNSKDGILIKLDNRIYKIKRSY
jgi:hypothetical protein